MTIKFESYLSHLAKSDGSLQSWGDHLTLDALSNVYRLRVWVIESGAGHECSLVAPQQRASRDIYLGHIGDRHYVSVTSSLVLLGSHINYILRAVY